VHGDACNLQHTAEVLEVIARCYVCCVLQAGRMDDDKSLLLALPDTCLLAVLQCCAADDQRSLFSAARAHGRLQQAAMVALHTISITTQDQQAK
jgi:hypothetical protein